MTPQQNELLDKIVRFYRQSGDFNGMPVYNLASDGEMQKDLVALIDQKKVDLVRGDLHPNPHIKAFDPEPPEVQIEKVENDGLEGCLYPTPDVLKVVYVNGDGGPYTEALELGAPQLSFRAFDLRVLEWYRNDPRFELIADDIHGRVIQRKNTKIEGRQIVRDELDFFEFGYAYNDNMERSIAAFLRY